MGFFFPYATYDTKKKVYATYTKKKNFPSKKKNATYAKKKKFTRLTPKKKRLRDLRQKKKKKATYAYFHNRVTLSSEQWVKNGSKTQFSKNDPGPFMMLKQVVLAHFEPVGTGFGSWKLPKCLENGPFWDQKWVKNGSKTRFSKSDPGPFGMLKQVFLARFEPVLTLPPHVCTTLCPSHVP